MTVPATMIVKGSISFSAGARACDTNTVRISENRRKRLIYTQRVTCRDPVNTLKKP